MLTLLDEALKPYRTASVCTSAMGDVTKASHNKRNIAIIVVVIVALAAAYVALSSGGYVLAQKTTVTSVGYSTVTTPQASSPNVVNGVITVGAGTHQAYEVTVPSGAYNVQLSGTFTANGGSGNDIIVYIFDSTNYVNW